MNQATRSTIESGGACRPGCGESLLKSTVILLASRLSFILPALGLLICVSDRGPTRALGADEAENIDLHEIERRVTQWRDSFVNLRVVWEVRILPETDEDVAQWPAPPDTSAIQPFLRTEWIWADHGLDLLEDRRFLEDDKGITVVPSSASYLNGDVRC